MRNGVPKIRRGFMFTLRRDRCVSHRRSQNWASRCAYTSLRKTLINTTTMAVLAIRHERWNYILFPRILGDTFSNHNARKFLVFRLILEPRSVDFSNPYSILLARARTKIPSTQHFSNAEFSSAYGTPNVTL